MKLSTFILIVVVITLFYGISLLFFPVQFIQNYGATLDPSSSVIARFYGSTMLSLAILYWMNRNIPESDKSWSGILWGGVFLNVTNLIVGLMARIDGIGNSLGWSTIILNGILALVTLYFIFRKKVSVS